MERVGSGKVAEHTAHSMREGGIEQQGGGRVLPSISYKEHARHASEEWPQRGRESLSGGSSVGGENLDMGGGTVQRQQQRGCGVVVV